MAQDARPHPRRAMSIALRMTVWYALTAFSLIFLATGVLYWVLVTSLHQENVRDLADNLNNARLLLGSLWHTQSPRV
jgi:two-component system, OmpR family, heavy metal sensor histidine kinase CusS